MIISYDSQKTHIDAGRELPSQCPEHAQAMIAKDLYRFGAVSMLVSRFGNCILPASYNFAGRKR